MAQSLLTIHFHSRPPTFKLTHFVDTSKGFLNSNVLVKVPIQVSPNIDPNVHSYISTGLKTSKFEIVENEVSSKDAHTRTFVLAPYSRKNSFVPKEHGLKYGVR